MANTKALALNPWLKILLWSKSGTGKTTLCGTMREFGPMYFFDCDIRMNVLAGLDIEYDTYSDPKPEFPTGFDKIMAKLDILHKNNPYTTVVLDGLTTLVPLVMNASVEAVNQAMTNKRVGKTVPNLPDYNAFKHFMDKLLLKFCSLKCHTVLTGHEVTDKDDISQRVFRNVACPGKAGDLLPGYFNEVWRMEVGEEAVPGKQGVYQETFKVRTRPTSVVSARTSYPKALGILEPASVPEMYAKINAWLQSNHSQAIAEATHEAIKTQTIK